MWTKRNTFRSCLIIFFVATPFIGAHLITHPVPKPLVKGAHVDKIPSATPTKTKSAEPEKKAATYDNIIPTPTSVPESNNNTQDSGSNNNNNSSSDSGSNSDSNSTPEVTPEPTVTEVPLPTKTPEVTPEPTDAPEPEVTPEPEQQETSGILNILNLL